MRATARADPPELLPEKLTDAQRRAVTHTGGPLLVVAGPGAGKTSVMVRRAAWLVREAGVDPRHLLVTTFTNKAAEELFDRLHPHVGRRTNDVHISTLHSFCRTVLEDHPRAHGRGVFRVLDAREQFLFVYARLKDLGLSDYPKRRVGDFIQNVLSTFNLCTEEGVDPDAFVAEVEARGGELLGLEKEAPEALEEYRAVAEAYGRYRKLLREEGLLDFSTLQAAAWEILREEDGARGAEQERGHADGAAGRSSRGGAPADPDLSAARLEAREALRDRFRWILVDEYQDTNRLQVNILRSLARPGNEITAVGDDDQSIYGFRGASVSSFLRFEEDFPGASRVDLQTNFRSTPPLVTAATSLIARNAPERTEKELRPRRRDLELPPVTVHRETSGEEAEAVVKTLCRWREEGRIRRWGDVTLLFRSVKSYAGPYLEALEERGVPFRVVSDGSFFDRADVEQVKRLFTFCGWKRRWRPEALDGPLLELSPRTLEALDDWDGDPVEWTDPDVLDEIGVGEVAERRVLAGLGELRRRTLDREFDADLLELFYRILAVTGYMERCCERGPCGPSDPEAEAALLNLARFSQLLSAFHRHVRSTGTYRLGQYLRSLPWRHLDELRPEAGEDAARVMTVHRAKGLEFPVVVLGAAMQNRFPGRFRPPKYPVPPGLKLSGDREDRDRHVRDERRLFYVGMTRAQDLLVLGTSDKVNKRGGGPSQFLDEIGDPVVPDPADVEPETLEREGRGETGERKRVSYSALHSYLLCPLQYHLLHEADFAVPEHHYFEFGRLVHRALEILHRRAADGETIDRGTVDEVWEEAWSPGRSWSEERRRRWEAQGRVYLRDYAAHHADRFERVAWVEEKVEVPLDPGDVAGQGLVVGGRVDLACETEDGGLEVVDFKVRSRRGLDILRPDYQVETYGLAADAGSERPVERVVLHLLAEDPGTELEIFEWTDELAAGAAQRLREAARGIAERRFAPTPGLHCELCDFRRHCPASQAREEEADDVPVGAAP